MIKLPKLKDLVKGKVYFSFYRDHTLWYKTDSGFEFPVSLEEIHADQNISPTFLAEDKGIYFMRFIRKYLETLEKELEKVRSGEGR